MLWELNHRHPCASCPTIVGVRSEFCRSCSVKRSHPGENIHFLDEFIVQKAGCWGWLGSKYKNGRAKWRGRPATRAIYKEFVGPLEDDQDAHHTCGNIACVNFHHLEAVDGIEHNRAHTFARYH